MNLQKNKAIKRIKPDSFEDVGEILRPFFMRKNMIDVIIKRIGGLMRLIELHQKTLRIRWGGQH